MEKLNNLDKLKSLSERINSLLPSPFLGMAKQVSAISESYNFFNEFNQRIKDGLVHPDVSQMIRDLESLNNPHIKMIQDINLQIFDNELIEKINSIGYWGQVANISLYEAVEASGGNREIGMLTAELGINNESINLDLEELDRTSLEIFNNLIATIKNYITANPSVKYSAIFILFVIQQILVPIILEKIKGENEITPIAVQVTNNYYGDKNVIAKVIRPSSMRNYPRNSSKEMFVLQENDQVEVLKDNVKWCLVIKTNTAMTGWVRKEYLNFSK
ncbi:SH3 domain-containing protein [Chryseobacterium sp. B21-037]|uniref:SH3 domain-containing protein n=1 Tax=Chryseobacterium sp. B21-037 TaxID=2926038 RepID=UPI002358C7C9|nr:SH3 domain-containing protein [Chryseobacterium sp. B21-037]MDC8105490.1 SH3 domain-containing protein [Chryseobacterium sp. B21-037]